MTILHDRLKQIWGYSEFRPPQGEIVQAILDRRDALIVLPTGGGKSLCFQLPAVMRSGLTIVVSPLVALMENQVQELQQRRVPAAMLHSELSASHRKQILSSIANYRLLYLSPETLLSASVWQRLLDPKLKINSLIIDEAHCLTQWGETFRPVYYRLGAVRSTLSNNRERIAIAAFTATANPLTQETIQRILQLETPQSFRLSPYRSNLTLQVQSVSTPRQRRQKLLEVIRSQFGSGLVYVRSRREGEELAEWLTQQGYRTAAYHAGLKSIDRRQIEQHWINDRLQFVVATCAFGMGVNKAATRWVVHYHAPFLMSEYVQEIGRAGRDGKNAIAVLLKSSWLDSEDRQRWRFFETQEHNQTTKAQKLIQKLPQQGNIDTVSREFKGASIALSLLHNAKQLIWTDPFHYEIQSKQKLPPSLLNSTQSMRTYLNTKDCRWRFVLRSFGFDQEAANFACGHCDNCARRFKGI
ncbi:MAG: RecQ family ATP-dependent DNA helicase [Plectolyngbya sp. WJT66-NPBG17]|jgi:ATP-dependent DNA helicase RecQ|nr:RecQ family ATP-dependent DNA helicase [Plectolyngbya sp. WJT66-NPBG17]MBW4528192.1 RecQ family ATP-dependent DNA helicase [Phormidium tanganyikae FI6-MK23]